ncbi:MAG: phage tail protein [Sphingomonadales bacterium]|nr:MAG: phage tail protein [Sphingomonadales bacterium]
MEFYLGQILYGGWNFAPRGTLTCDGQLLPISQNTALFSLLGTSFGGNGQNTFALPDLRGRAPLHWGQGPGLSPYTIGEASGMEQETMTSSQLPVHTHAAMFTPGGGGGSPTVTVHGMTGISTNDEETEPSAGCFLGTSTTPLYVPATTTGGTPVNLGGVSITGVSSGGGAVTVGTAGGSQPFSLMQPYLAITAVIVTSGVFPSRN